MVKLVSRDQIVRRERGQRMTYFPCSVGHEQDWQAYSVYPVRSDDHAYILHDTKNIRNLALWRSESGVSVILFHLCTVLLGGHPERRFP